MNSKYTWKDNLAAIFEAKLKGAIDNRGGGNDNFQTLFLTQKYGLFNPVLSIDIYLSGLLARRQNAWSQDGGNMRVIGNGVNR